MFITELSNNKNDISVIKRNRFIKTKYIIAVIVKINVNNNFARKTLTKIAKFKLGTKTLSTRITDQLKYNCAKRTRQFATKR